jgi:tRNA pseudouridine38-40 synthase
VSAPEDLPARTLRLIIEYDGTDFHGWQRQLGQRTVQACLEEALQTMTGEARRVTGAGRTDAGVHAEGQVASVTVHSRIPTGGFLRGLNATLPPDMAVREVSDVDAAFDARRSARGKTYRYQIWNHVTRSPLQRRAAWQYRAPLDTQAMREAAAGFVGEHDFRAFRASDCDRKNTVRLIRAFEVERRGALIRCEVEGTAFLKNMVRIMVGTLVQAGHGELDPAGLRRLLEAGDRTQSGVTAPAHGLTLVRVIY